MKRFLPALILVLLLLPLFSFPAAGEPLVFSSAVVTTQPATDITANSAILHAVLTWPSISQNNHAAGLTPASYNTDTQFAVGLPASTGYFRYGTSSAALTYTTPSQVVPWGTVNFAAEIVSLFPCTTYYYQPVWTVSIAPVDYQPSPYSFLVALATVDGDRLTSGLGIGLNRLLPDRGLLSSSQTVIVTGGIQSFSTTGCVTSIGSHNAAGVGNGQSGSMGPSNITVNTASLSASRVAPGEKIDITAMVANRGNANGESRITLYVNGQQVESKGVTLASGQSTPVHFYISENEPGTYNVHVGGVSAGSFTVDAFANNDILIYGIIALFTIGIAGTLFLLARKNAA